MKALSTLAALLWAGSLAGHAASYTLAGCAFNIDGTTTFLNQDSPLPFGVNVAG